MGLDGEADEVSLPKRVPWTLILFVIAALIPVLGATGRFQLVFGALATIGLLLSS